MKNYKEIRRINNGSLRTLCIENNYYTKGDNQQYNKLLRMADKGNITTQDIAEMANDIKEHSITEHDVETIMFEIARRCCSWFEAK